MTISPHRTSKRTQKTIFPSDLTLLPEIGTVSHIKEHFSMRILHFSDSHLSGPNLAEANPCCKFIIDTARKEDPDLIVFTGDLFDRADVSLDSAAVKFAFYLFKSLADVAPVAAIIGTPSHDGKAAEVLEHIEAAFPIHVTADGPEQLWLHHGEFGDLRTLATDSMPPDAIISTIPAPTKKFFKTDSSIQEGETDIATAMSAIFAGFGASAEPYGCPHILLGHWNVTGAFVSGSQTLTGMDVEISKDQMALGNFDLVCLGHIHKAQQIGDNIFMAGSTQNNNWGEQDPKGFYLHHTEEGHELGYSDFIETPTRPMIDLAYDYTQNTNDTNNLYKMDLPESARVRLRVNVFVDEVDTLPDFEGFFKDAGADLTLELIRMPRTNVRSKRILELEGLYPKIQENAEILEESVPGGVESKVQLLESESPEKILEEVRAL